MILVVGDAILDVDRRFTTTRMCPEKDDAPVLTPLHTEAEMRLGGALNVWNAINRLGTECSFITCVGNDQPADVIKRVVGSGRHALLSSPDANPTTVKERVYVDGVLRWRMDNDRQPETITTQLNLTAHVVMEIDRGHADLLVLSDYGKGVLAKPQEMIAYARRKGIPVLVDPKGSNWDRYRGATVIKPNANEMLGEADTDYILATRGEEGMALTDAESEGCVYIEGHSRKVVDVTGAGDMACAALAVCLAKGMHVLFAAEVANVLAGWSVEFQGVKTFTKDEAIDECARYGIAFPK